MRDDFSIKTKETLGRRVGFKCSNPDCGMSTIGPHDNPEKSSNIGVAAHITAASEGGPRYDSILTSEERKSINNGIWLCQSCSRLIDIDINKYQVSLLNNWKSQKESIAASELNKQLKVNKETQELKTIPENGFHETKVGEMIVRYFIKNGFLHVETDDNGIISYVVLDPDGNTIDFKWPYPLEEYSLKIDPKLILKEEKENLKNGFFRRKTFLKWGKYVEAIFSKDGIINLTDSYRYFFKQHIECLYG